MSKLSSLKSLLLKSGLAALALSLVATLSSAQQPSTVRIRGTIEAVDGPVLTIKTREGTDTKVKMTDDVAVFAVVKTSLSEIRKAPISASPACRSRTAARRRSPFTSSRRTSAARRRDSGPGIASRTRP